MKKEVIKFEYEKGRSICKALVGGNGNRKITKATVYHLFIG